MEGQKISLMTAILMNLNIMMGSGILIGPGVMAGIAGNASFLTWFVVALIFLPLVLSTVQLSKMCPGAGGFYAYAKEGLTPAAGYWSGWVYMTGYTFAVAVQFIFLRQTMLSTLGDTWWTGSPYIFTALALGLAIAINLLSLKFFGSILNSLTISKVLPIVILIALIPLVFTPSFTVTTAELTQLPKALPLAIFSYFGFEYCCSISHLIENSERNAPLAILGGFLLTALMYTLFHFGLLNLMGSENLATFGAPAYANFLNLPIPYLKETLIFIIPLASVLTIFATTCGLINANAVMLHTMAQEDLFHISDWLKPLSRNYRPYVTILVIGAIAYLLAVGLPNIEVMGDLANIAIISSFTLPFVSLFALQKKAGLHGKLPLTVLATGIILGLIVYSFVNLTLSGRLIALVPLAISLAIGLVLYKKK